MKKLLITLILISPFSFADWGDVYYCKMTNMVNISLKGERENFKLERFQFKLDKAKQAMVFGGEGYYGGTEYKLIPNMHWPIIETWYSEKINSDSFFREGKFLSMYISQEGVMTVSADCDKF